jgi:hypothetical protein
MIFIGRNFKYYLLFLIVFYIHVNINSSLRMYAPTLPILDNAPSKSQFLISSLGNEEYLFRYYTVQLQNSGDTFGRFTPLREYNYQYLRDWMINLDILNDKSSALPALASYYYSNTQNIADNIFLIEYLEQNYYKHPELKWWWMTQAISLARFKLRDNVLALKLALILKENPNKNMPKWARQLPALVYADLGEKELALAIVKDLIENSDDYSQSELNYMSFFLKEKLKIDDYSVNKKPKYQDVEPY